MKTKIRCAILGATGLVGQQFVRLLADHPFFELAMLTSSTRSAGQSYAAAVHWMVGGAIPPAAAALVLQETSAERLLTGGIKIVFSALPTALAGDLEHTLRSRGLAVFSNASSHRMDADVPIMIPEVNAEQLALARLQQQKHGGFIVTCSNCTASGLVMALKPLLHLQPKTVFVSSYQAMSGAGRQGIFALDISGNVLPFIRNEEEKLEAETVKMLGTVEAGAIVPAAFEVNANCSRVPVRDGHFESVAIEWQGRVTVADVEHAYAGFKNPIAGLALPTAPLEPIIVHTDVNRPQPFLDALAGSPARAAGMAVSVGRIRQKASRTNLNLLVHNTIRGAAGTCILNAELAAVQECVL